jgi:TatD DNase family protein
MTLPPIDAHAHIDVRIEPRELRALDAFVMAVTSSLDEGDAASRRRDAMTVWGLGCHPAVPAAVAAFAQDRFASLLLRSAFVGEVGLDRRSRVPMDTQVAVLGQILDLVRETPRPVSLHSTGATGPLLDVLERHPVTFPILHWWRGTPAETLQAVELGCLFSLNGHESRSPKVVPVAPGERVLTETDFPHTRRYDATANRPGATETIERLLADSAQQDAKQLRSRMWNALAPLLTTIPEEFVSADLATVQAVAEGERGSGAAQLRLGLASDLDHSERHPHIDG